MTGIFSGETSAMEKKFKVVRALTWDIEQGWGFTKMGNMAQQAESANIEETMPLTDLLCFGCGILYLCTDISSWG